MANSSKTQACPSSSGLARDSQTGHASRACGVPCQHVQKSAAQAAAPEVHFNRQRFNPQSSIHRGQRLFIQKASQHVVFCGRKDRPTHMGEVAVLQVPGVALVHLADPVAALLPRSLDSSRHGYNFCERLQVPGAFLQVPGVAVVLAPGVPILLPPVVPRATSVCLCCLSSPAGGFLLGSEGTPGPLVC